MSAIQSPSEQEIDSIKKEMLKSSRIDLNNFKLPFLIRRITTRMMARGVRTGSEYFRLLSEDPLEPLSLYKSLSINVTECFRNPEVWEVFSTSIIPKVLKNKNMDSPIRIWSAGCATGEEPYSLAMMLKYAIDSRNIELKIAATDINQASINIAKTGKYELKGLKNMPSHLFSRYVKKLDDDLYQINDDVKKSVNFQYGDILSTHLNSLDIIVCRNLLIYYARDEQELIFKKFYDCLNKNGFVVLGMDETMIGTIGSKLFKVIHPRQRIFEKL